MTKYNILKDIRKYEMRDARKIRTLISKDSNKNLELIGTPL